MDINRKWAEKSICQTDFARGDQPRKYGDHQRLIELPIARSLVGQYLFQLVVMAESSALHRPAQNQV